jgi:ribonuclease HII
MPTVKTGIPAIDDARNTCIVGSDEVGLGAWAGPAMVCAAAVFCEWNDLKVTDSKKMTRKARERIYERYINDDHIVISLVEIPVEEIDRVGVHEAVRAGHKKAIEGTFWRLVYPPVIVVDGIVAPDLPNAICLPKADALVPAVSLASVIAKVTRDRMMVELDKQYPGYGLASNMGYGTPSHQQGLIKLGVSPIHRRSFQPIADLLKPPTENEVLAYVATLPEE